MDPVQKSVKSKDGTVIAYEQSGRGPAVILVASSLADRSDTKRLAALLAPQFTVINYDRRGRGLSGDTPPYQVQREVEDIAALLDEAGGSACLFGSSSGAVLALEAAASDLDITKLALYEPPFRVDRSELPKKILIGRSLSSSPKTSEARPSASLCDKELAYPAP
jgi:pimeloyl-ACP methyl ester carboxylesterase